jgi:hypothetical protein
VCSNPFVTFILKGKHMNTTTMPESKPAAEVPLNRAAKEALLRQMYSQTHWIELVRLIGYRTIPMPSAPNLPVRQPRNLVLKRCEEWLKETGVAFVAVKDVRRTTPAVASYVGVLDFIVLRGEEKLLVTVRPHLLAKHLKLLQGLQNLFGAEYKPLRIWPTEGPHGWNWHDHAIEPSGTNPNCAPCLLPSVSQRIGVSVK